ncbi:WecB/TagA/CpsF family glycosyltransferase [Rhizobium lentis]|uniref:WecB/TagA/CpsF family glycosyltransferase n=1 Tax=Rhizobium TaxID=379 RepID=UPI00160A3A17|nr:MULTISPECIES: WecB/TagA/CpsF family glycosyltransferase [Rhizobium]MBB3351449.1 N-acetylglucosaminyldiphosphoundecaprenol N-acetyl-beta-D-mannosaminyltransferase [Rhizobium sp. BK049]MBX5133006.1 WecB/TagA/CpsF family glycosyltransferase [Rhizobium lentis]MBX5138423.1 WecB/TagA/CpsF family glycosyltransferase [Rhizobium lentis]MBX5149857.1 WecB/TagA/CpsF family glycosyltransferase [Rhizobium lentis]MBX5177041.1 WecB/TagA/CpsF family glycosyltransferase [Rhizobium lentis]
MGKQPTDRSQTSVLKQKDSLEWTNVLGVRISAVNLKSATGFIQKGIEDGRREYVCVRDAHGVVRCQDDPELRSIHNRAFLVTPDGMPLVWALKRAGHVDSDRVYGPDLMLSVFEAGTSKGIRHFLYGATPETLQHLQAQLLAKFPEAEIAGSYAPPFHKLSPQEEADIADRLNRSGADIIWVGLSSPKQELWMARMRDRLDASMLIGVGAAFDFHAGLKRQAPRFIQRSGFEWAFRLLCEPRRLWRRYALVVPTFISLTAFQRLGLRKFPIEDEVFGSSAPKATAVKV